MTDFDAIVVGGGHAGLAAAHALRTRGLAPVLLEAGPEPVGSWPHYYDSLTLFSPARYSSLPGLPFPGDPDRYPHRDEVVDYLRNYAAHLDVDIRTRHRVTAVTRDGGGFTAHATGETAVRAPVLIAATGGFGRPHRPALPGLAEFTGTVLHSSDYREPGPFTGQRVIVVGAGNSAVQIAVELAAHARVSLATRAPVKFAPQRPLGRDVHFWSATLGFDHLPIGHLLRSTPASPVLDSGRYREALAAGSPDRRDMFTRLEDDQVRWPDGSRERVDAVILATGFRPELSYLEDLGALTEDGIPLHSRGLSTVVDRLGYVGLEWQRSLASATVRGVGRDATYVTARLSTNTVTRRCCAPAG
ncbi:MULTISPECIES: NAD(P)-binding domain-containing protein [unclassified Amycolatopsis]|uniref:flavin-containing monooxygenase n=1 Tax=unclassified Amycolatopsis TaxID=2618356 RepID=UPI002873FFDB|nr:MULTISPECIES: NAD(P)-binding domain-containing protein [unclassified Amycolatopsis]MDS0137541.1 NAD(P)-binding domain-containing protein [Amycolatopsis sp. 505]MDS0141736.1 NAD(P)-binding domain-containing protein [Amycolatopsis sp. CM201R]